MGEISISINGEARVTGVHPRTPLLWVLRDTFGLTGTKYGCGIAQCDMAIVHDEIFGPVLAVIPFDGEEEAIRIANDTPYGLASGIYSQNLARALRLADRINAGTVWINTWHKYHPNAPFGGYKMSGYGREQGAEALESHTHTRPSGRIPAEA
jgi:acyl-CoA reductase-like NAD-dependent aldehyde dehydrogenase